LQSSTHHESPEFRHVCFSQIRSSTSRRSSVAGFPGFRPKEAVSKAVNVVVEIVIGFEEPHLWLSADSMGLKCEVDMNLRDVFVSGIGCCPGQLQQSPLNQVLSV
jgi:hypothetical protein